MRSFQRFVHPFPARMAPEIVDNRIGTLDPETTVLDPMMGSGSFVLAAARAGLTAVGLDTDPLAVLIAQAAAGVKDPRAVMGLAEDLVAHHRPLQVSELVDDLETQSFISFWFDECTASKLAGLARAISTVEDSQAKTVLWCAFSRLIVTKGAGVSRAQDVSHSRPHIVRDSASFDPIERYVRAVKTVLDRSHSVEDMTGQLTLLRADSRRVPLKSASIDALMTSPPYLNAIDYLRGHRLSLVWMGYSIAGLRALRGENIGSERGRNLSSTAADLLGQFTDIDLLPRKKALILNRYVADLSTFVSEAERVLKGGGQATFVVANSTHQSVAVRVDRALEILCDQYGLELSSREVRPLPAQRRYLPPPAGEKSMLNQRMAEEVILTFRKAHVRRSELEVGHCWSGAAP